FRMRQVFPRCYLDCVIFGDRPCFECLIYQVGHEERKAIGDWRAGYSKEDIYFCTIFATKKDKEWSRRYWLRNYQTKGMLRNVRPV
ncbi:hypothetical protein PFISCL1PPCAC_21225, partial [Pristionchus fissidentatus]